MRIRQAGIGFGEPGLGLDLRLEARDRLTQRWFGRRLSADDRGSDGSNDVSRTSGSFGMVELAHDTQDVRIFAARRSNQVAMGSQLTPRERQLIGVILEGAGNREIAARLGLKEQTVKNQLATLYRKTGASSRLELAMFAVQGRLEG